MIRVRMLKSTAIVWLLAVTPAAAQRLSSS
jgi:hypothetical protein